MKTFFGAGFVAILGLHAATQYASGFIQFLVAALTAIAVWYLVKDE